MPVDYCTYRKRCDIYRTLNDSHDPKAVEFQMLRCHGVSAKLCEEYQFFLTGVRNPDGKEPDKTKEVRYGKWLR